MKLDFGMKSAVKFITFAVSRQQQKKNQQADAERENNKIKFNNKCSPFYNGKFSDSKTCFSDFFSLPKDSSD